jgi:GNAT superfamily N-acetyltransferase
MTDQYEIINTTKDDLQFVFTLFDHSVSYQQSNGYPDWENYDRNAIKKDTENKNQYKIMLGDEIAMVFSACYTDKLIWREMDKGESIYLHRIVVNPACKGRKLFGVLFNWSVSHAKDKGLKNIRMDTWAANNKIIGYYESFGFTLIESYTTPNLEALPVHNRNLAMALLEFKLTV